MIPYDACQAGSLTYDFQPTGTGSKPALFAMDGDLNSFGIVD
jgi:hypothetical protein